MQRNTLIKMHSIASERKVKVLTSYTANVARFTEQIADALLVGDSLGMVLYNMPSTHGVTMEMMQLHTSAVFSATSRPLIIADMPFGSFESSIERAFENAAILIKAGAGAIKIEGGEEIAETINFIVKRGIPVVGHVGLMPQKVYTIGGYGKVKDYDFVLKNFEAVYQSGAFAVVLENLDEEITNAIAKKFPDALTIGIGAGSNCKGHVAVFEDLINLSTANIPPFSKNVFDIKLQTKNLIEEYFDKI